MLRKLLGITGVAAFLVFSLGGGGELLAQNLGDQLLSDPDEPVTRVGTRGGAFLSLGVGARATALSGAGTTISQGVHALYWNPAGTAMTESFSFGFSYAEIFKDADINQYFTGALLPIFGGVVGLSLNTLDSGDIPRTVETTPSSENVGIGSTFSWTSTAVGLHYARLITDRLAVGATGKWVNEGIDGAEANWIALDMGVKFETGLYGTTLSGVVTNISGKSEMTGNLIERIQDAGDEVFESGRDLDVGLLTTKLSLPTTFSFGVQFDLAGTPEALLTPDPRHHLAALVDLRDATDSDIRTMLAVEYGYNDILFVRGGKRWMNENRANRDFSDGLSFGFGLKVPVIGRHLLVDYAYTALVDGLDRQQVFSFEYGI